MKKAFGTFSAQDTIDWFTERGVPLKTEDDGRMFPVANTSQAVIDCLLNEARSAGIDIRMKAPIQSIEPVEGG